MNTIKSELSPFAEVVESSLRSWTAQSWQWDNAPLFGSLVAIKHASKTFFGLVYDLKTGSSDLSRSVGVYQKTPEQLVTQYPQLFEFLKTTFSCVSVGYQDDMGTTHYTLPSTLIPLHAFVYQLDDSACQSFFSEHHYMGALFSLHTVIGNVDELVIALLGNYIKTGVIAADSIKKFLDIYCAYIGSDYRRLKFFLARVQPLID